MTTAEYWESRIARPSYMAARAILNGQSYWIGDAPKDISDYRKRCDQKDLGMGGRGFEIEFLDGRKVTTVNLWGQGEIPTEFRDRLPDNVKAIRTLGNVETLDLFRVAA